MKTTYLEDKRKDINSESSGGSELAYCGEQKWHTVEENENSEMKIVPKS